MKPSIAAYQDELAAAFALRRCRCGAPASAVVVGMNLVRKKPEDRKHRAQPDLPL